MKFRKLNSTKIWSFFFTLSLVATGSLTSSAATITLNPTKDNSIYEENGSFSNALGGLFSGKTGGGGGTLSRRALLAFDISGISAGSSIDSVSLQLQLIQTSDTNSRTMGLHRLTSDWGEETSSGGGQGAAADVNDATWTDNFFQSSLWSTAGGDFVSLESASLAVGGSGSYTWSSTTLASATLASDVQDWLDGNADNFGWILIGDEANLNTARVFASRENPNSNFRPRLTVEFTPVPEPTTMLLGVIGFVAVLLFRNRTKNSN